MRSSASFWSTSPDAIFGRISSMSLVRLEMVAMISVVFAGWNRSRPGMELTMPQRRPERGESLAKMHPHPGDGSTRPACTSRAQPALPRGRDSTRLRGVGQERVAADRGRGWLDAKMWRGQGPN